MPQSGAHCSRFPAGLAEFSSMPVRKGLAARRSAKTDYFVRVALRSLRLRLRRPTLTPRPAARHEFICGVYTWFDAAMTAPTAEPHVDQPPGRIWEALVGDRETSSGCAEVKRLLRGDEACVGEQCRAAARLAFDFIAQCRQMDPEGARDVRRWRRAWQQQAPRRPPDQCFSRFVRSIGSAQRAQRDQQTCLKAREGGYLERLLIKWALAPNGPRRGSAASTP